MVDLTFLKEFTGGNHKKMIRYINLYLENTPASFDQMQRNIDNQDWSRLAINAHSLKPQAEFKGIKSLKDILADLENCARQGKVEHVESLFKNARQQQKESEKHLFQFLESLDRT